MSILGVFGGMNSAVFGKLDKGTKALIGIFGGFTSSRGASGHFSDVMRSELEMGRYGGYHTVHGIKQTYNGKVMKMMKTPSRSSRNERFTYQGLWQGIKDLFKRN